MKNTNGNRVGYFPYNKSFHLKKMKRFSDTLKLNGFWFNKVYD